MKGRNATIVGAVCILSLSLAGMSVAGSFVAQREQERQRRETQAVLERQLEPARELFAKAGVPIDAGALLRQNWREELSPVLDSLEAMKTVRFLDGPLNGVQLADTLCLPEHVELTGDTVILTRHMRFEGSEPVIRGNHNIYLFLIDSVGALGRPLEKPAGKRGRGEVSSAGDMRVVPIDIAARPYLRHSRITIDTHGEGYAEWVARHGGSEQAQHTLRGAQQGDVLNTTIDKHGNPGDIGSQGADGAQPTQGNPQTGNKGPNGTCGSVNTVNGGKGQDGGDAGDAGDAGGAGKGMTGGNGGTIFLSASQTATSQNWVLDSHGGRGGQGGTGGFGYDGLPGGTGGPGGDGANCQCIFGGGGIGGKGGTAGRGGKGGNGGRGGQGGDGGTGGPITVDLPCNYTGSIDPNAAKGGVGPDGVAGHTGMAGAAGSPGDPGPGPTFPLCSASPGGMGSSGDPNGTNGPGTTPDPPDANTNGGSDGAITQNPATGCGGGGSCAYCLFDGDCDPSLGGCWQTYTWYCDLTFGCQIATPIVIDVEGDGFDLTDGADGVQFDLVGHGKIGVTAWTSRGSDDAWLALDRNGNGVIDSGAELFGNVTEQPTPASGVKNGFLALAEFDKPENGGDGDGRINKKDAIFSSLRLWQDRNHNGISESGELHTLRERGVAILELDYQESMRIDEHGNQFMYRARVRDTRGAQIGRWAWDILPVRGKP